MEEILDSEYIGCCGVVGRKSSVKGKIYPNEEKVPLVCHVSASARDLNSLAMEKEDIDALDGSSPRGILEDRMGSDESESSSKPSTSYSETPANPSVPSQFRGLFRLWKNRSMRRLATFPPKLSKRYTSVAENQNTETSATDEAESNCFKPSWKNFTLAELRAATNNFNSENIVGKGGYAEVYKGCLPDGQLVAIKRLTRGTAEEQAGDFLAELGIIVHIDHPNAAKLIGYGLEGGMYLVLELSPNGSLASLLHGSKEKMDWRVRFQVAVGTAEGLRYLHESCQRRIVHRDIKAANILLTADFEPQICDFGLAKWLPDQWTHHTVSNFEGTFGYLPPEYFMHGIVDEKTDVFAFGVLLLELITGRKAIDSSRQSLVMWAKPLLEKNDMKELLDPSIINAHDSQQMNRMISAANLCIQHSSLQRPQMNQVVELLRGEGSSESTKLSQGRVLQRTYSEELFDIEEYNTTRYLNDLNRHRQIALEF